MWGDYQVDDPNTLTQAQKNKLINQAKLIAGITAAYAGEDVNVAASVAAEAVRWNSLRAVVSSLKIGNKLRNIYKKNNRLTWADARQAVKEEGIDIADNILTLADGQLTLDDAKAFLDLLAGTEFNNANKGELQDKSNR
ncbi:hypothetical protein AO373_1945 [Moraxella catarrhalis]|nr:hypothetical protein AO373_1945 [Moraxella catarrhalis]